MPHPNVDGANGGRAGRPSPKAQRRTWPPAKSWLVETSACIFGGRSVLGVVVAGSPSAPSNHSHITYDAPVPTAVTPANFPTAGLVRSFIFRSRSGSETLRGAWVQACQGRVRTVSMRDFHTSHNHIGHNNIDHNYIGHNYIGHNCMGHNYIGQRVRTSFYYACRRTRLPSTHSTQ